MHQILMEGMKFSHGHLNFLKQTATPPLCSKNPPSIFNTCKPQNLSLLCYSLESEISFIKSQGLCLFQDTYFTAAESQR
ncbi:hypothetical protein SLEP1_g13895 [Rubroshorea leprosula]|uniref:Uncharacterized protein n=1 Tax=Rubroshorea leprosula TaxID=152421 RepID=A0AAV5IQB7_9ROSI|nr:hypothetical protein SLEP1_g13895 [Rubroshorea leprosula]